MSVARAAVVEGHIEGAAGRPWRGRVSLVAGVAAATAALLTAYILVAHRVHGRDTTAATALAWSVATVGAWAAVALPGLGAAEWLAARRDRWSPSVIARDLLLVVAIAAVAAVLRAAVDPLLPEVARAGGTLAGRAGDYALRWSGAGSLAGALVVLAGSLRARRTPPTTPPALPPATPEAEPAADHSATPTAPLRTLVVRVGTRSVALAVDEVRWIEASANYAVLHTRTGRLSARITMAELEARLDAARFVRVHRSAIVALDQVREVRTGHGATPVLALGDGATVPLSRVGRRALEARLGRRV